MLAVWINTRASFYLAPEGGRETAPVSPVVPMLKEDDVVGAIVIYQKEVLDDLQPSSISTVRASQLPVARRDVRVLGWILSYQE